ncbi:hypothetical protein PF006_g33045 [Phytophthora fragariae]|uniref:Uncharacterized protein n=1 Tax=Phytophthora fragariae TaxID=53985 RepID=A0A6A3PI27_9STRA|nr:hypothetical protein PF009_g32316 [Phytophthora fragariae]KAE8917363.1 hypothetical protein PF009_g32315 [Phytophthora fragariae]KAE8953754.1 hypothetical protein PF011_g32326 [Phytophthora fragariae]KAE9055165.1 hypothetical protein PF006_g33046 [Phytophthora fragariae]KAE9055166.1 hypothetical protein PF006_g33045 [Phytophthora fragariae]
MRASEAARRALDPAKSPGRSTRSGWVEKLRKGLAQHMAPSARPSQD